MDQKSKIKGHRSDDLGTIEILGDLTGTEAKDMDAAFQKACSGNPSKMLLKFHDKTHFNSSGIAIVINTVIDSQDRGCKVFVTGLSRHYKKIFEITGLTKYTTIVDSEQEI